MIKWGTISMVLVVVLVSSCSSTKNGENSDREDLTAKELRKVSGWTMRRICR